MCSEGKGLRHCSLAGEIRDVVLLHLLFFLPVLIGANTGGPYTVKMNVRSFLMLILHCETGAKSLGPALVHSTPSPLIPHSPAPSHVCCLCQRGDRQARAMGVVELQLSQGGLDWLSEHLDVGELVCLLLSLRFLPDSAICWSKSPSAFDFCIVKRKKMSLSLWYCTHVTDCKTDTGFAK